MLIDSWWDAHQPTIEEASVILICHECGEKFLCEEQVPFEGILGHYCITCYLAGYKHSEKKSG